MANEKISGLDPSVTLTGSEEIPVVQTGDTVKTTAQDIADLAVGGSPLSTADQTIAATGTRKVTLGGSLVTDLVKFENSATDPLLEVRGDKSVTLPTGYLGVGTTAVGGGFGGHKFSVVNSTGSSAIKVSQTGVNGKALELLLSATSGSQYGFYVTSSNANAVNKYGSLYNITGATGSGVNTAIQVDNGNIVAPNLPTSSAGLASGTFWNDSGTLKIA
jgi:hypothetical protein